MDIKEEQDIISSFQIKKESIFYITHPKMCGDDFFTMTAIGHLFCNANYSTKRLAEDRADFLIIYVLKGRLKTIVNNIVNIAEACDIALINCKNEHYYSSNNNSAELLYFHFNGSTAEDIVNNTLTKFSTVIRSPFFERHTELIFNLLGKIYNKQLVLESEPSILIYTVLSQLFGETTLVYQEKYSPIINTAITYLKESGSNIRINDLAKRLFITPQHLMRLFKQELQISPKQYLLNYQLSQARNLLLTTNLTIENISHEIGFSTTSNFMTKFKQSFGITPTAYRLNK